MWIRVLDFLVDHRRTKFMGSPHLNEGDRVTVAGRDFRGAFRALALRNDSTGVEYPGPVASYVGLALLELAIVAPVSVGLAYVLSRLTGGFAGFPLFMASFMVMPLLMSAGGLLFEARQNARANRTLRATPELPDAATSAPGPLEAEEPEGAGRTLVRFCVGAAGMVLCIAGILLTSLAISMVPEEPGPGGLLARLILCVPVAIGGFAMARWGFGPRPRATQR